MVMAQLMFFSMIIINDLFCNIIVGYRIILLLCSRSKLISSLLPLASCVSSSQRSCAAKPKGFLTVTSMWPLVAHCFCPWMNENWIYIFCNVILFSVLAPCHAALASRVSNWNYFIQLIQLTIAINYLLIKIITFVW